VLADYGGFHANAYQHLVPGGWLEVRENDLWFLTDNAEDESRLVALRHWEALMEEAAAKFGKRINVAAEQKALMHSAGFVQVEEQIFKVRLKEKNIQRPEKLIFEHLRPGTVWRVE
jgi:hypothetical protein